MFHPACQISPGDKIFTIGSCFARNVEKELDKRGFQLPAWDVLKQDAEFAKFGPNILNNYTVGSIYNEVAWAFDPEYKFVDDLSFFEIYPGKFIDIHLNRGFKPAPIETVRARRAAITAVYKQISQCPLVIITLGLAESWFDIEMSVYLNARPHHAMFSKHPGRYELHVMDYADVMTSLRGIFDLLQANLFPGGKVLLTISPVPLQRTYRDCDVMVANTYSKAVLRAAAEEINASYDFVTYYPSFESVSLTRRDLAWDDDQTHVKKEIVDVNVSRMIAAYTGSIDPGASELSGATLEIIDSIRNKVKVPPSAIFGALENASESLLAEPEIALAFCEACLDLGKLGLARSALARVPVEFRGLQQKYLTGKILFAEGASESAEKVFLDLLESDAPKHMLRDIWLDLLRAILAQGNVEAAVTHMGKWKAAMRKIPGVEPYRLVAGALAKAGDPVRAESYFQMGLGSTALKPEVLILDYAGFLADQGRSDEAREYLSRIDATSRRITARIEDLLVRLPTNGRSQTRQSPSVEESLA